MRTEQECRRDGFEPGVPIRLWDGQEWQFPRPRVKWRRVWREDIPDVEPRHHLGPAFDAALKSYGAAELVRAGADAALAVAESMLLHNYDLSRDELADLLEFDYGDPANQEVWTGILNVAYGIAPKPEAGSPA